MSNERSKKDKEMAAYLKKLGVVRTTSACVWHCGAQVKVGGTALVAHLGVCQGPKRGRR